MDCGNRLNVSVQALVDAGMKKNDVISYFFPREHWQSFLCGGGDSDDVMGKSLSQRVLIIKMCALTSGTAVGNNFLKIRRKKVV